MTIHTLILSVIGIFAPFVGADWFGVWGVFFGLLISGLAIANFIEERKLAHWLKNRAPDPLYPEITTCLKCSGDGHFTASDGEYVGYRCASCNSFWKKKIKQQQTTNAEPHLFMDREILRSLKKSDDAWIEFQRLKSEPIPRDSDNKSHT